eukprot:5432407-Pleurochrysis_carterae.AAC.1
MRGPRALHMMRRPDRLSRGCGPGACGPTGDSFHSWCTPRVVSALGWVGWGSRCPGAPQAMGANLT